MDMQRRKAVGLGLLGWGILGAPGMVPLTGCFTSEFLNKDHRPSYAEILSGLLITPDRSQLIVTGPRYHYIFAMPPLLGRVFASDWQSAVRAHFNTFAVDANGRISGTVSLSLDAKAGDDVTQAALGAGFTRRAQTSDSTPPKASQLFATLNISGQRFLANGVQPGAQQTLNKEYSITIKEPENAVSIAGKVAATPLYVAADGLLIVAVAGVAVVLIAVSPLILLARAASNSK